MTFPTIRAATAARTTLRKTRIRNPNSFSPSAFRGFHPHAYINKNAMTTTPDLRFKDRNIQNRSDQPRITAKGKPASKPVSTATAIVLVPSVLKSGELFVPVNMSDVGTIVPYVHNGNSESVSTGAIVLSVPKPAKAANNSNSKPVSTAVVISNPKPAKTADVESKQSLFQALTQRKVLIAAAAVLSIAGIAATAGAAYYFYPVATAAYAAIAGNAGRAALMNTHQLFIQPGFANTLFMANFALQAAIIPAAKITLPVLLPVISTAIVTTLCALAALYVANRVWIAAKAVIWGAGSAVVNKFGQELDKTYVGMAAKSVVVSTVSPLVAPFMEEEKSETKLDVNTAKIMPARGDDEEFEVEVQPRSQISDSSVPSVQEVDVAEAEQIDALRVENNREEKSAQEKAQSSWGNFLMAGLITAAGVGAGLYFSQKMPLLQMDVLTGQ